MNLKKYLPTPEQLSQEAIATLFGAIVAAWIISRVPAIRNLVQQSNTNPM